MTDDIVKPSPVSDATSGLLSRLTRGLFGSFATGGTAPVGQAPPLDPRLESLGRQGDDGSGRG